MPFFSLTMFLDTPREVWTAAGDFWSAATGWPTSPPRGERGRFVTLQPATGAPWVKLQAVPGPAAVHLDVSGVDRTTAEDLGARFAWRYADVDVMRSPGGLAVCLQPSIAETAVQRNDRSVLDQVCLDIPARTWDTETAFWQALTGRPSETGARDEYAFLGSATDPARQPRILLQRLDADQPAVTAHPDFAVADRAAETARHEDLGARVVAVHEWWTVLDSPSGHRYCLTGRDPATGAVDPRLRSAAAGRHEA